MNDFMVQVTCRALEQTIVVLTWFVGMSLLFAASVAVFWHLRRYVRNRKQEE